MPDTTRDEVYAADEAAFGRPYAEAMRLMRAAPPDAAAILANVIRLVECEWQDDVPLARLYTLRQALGLTTDYPIDEDMWEADIARHRALLDAALAYVAAHAAEVAARQAHRAAYRDTETVGTVERLRCVERLAAAWEATRAALAALHAAYAAYAGAREEEPDGTGR